VYFLPLFEHVAEEKRGKGAKIDVLAHSCDISNDDVFDHCCDQTLPTGGVEFGII
jgi:hypothetical protein